MVETVLKGRAIQLFFGSRLMEDIPADRMTEQPGNIRNHAAWQIGHIVVSNDSICKMVDVDLDVPKDWYPLFERFSQPVADASKYPAKDELVSAFQTQHEKIAAALPKVPADKINAPIGDEKLSQMFATNLDFVTFGLLTHETVHLGQLGMWRRAIGLGYALPEEAEKFALPV